MKALTLWQPWAHIVCAGIKKVENRRWRPPRHAIGQRLAIHAGKVYDKDGAATIKRLSGLDIPESACTKGAIIGTAKLVAHLDSTLGLESFVGEGQKKWFFGPIGWLLDDIMECEPVPCAGALGLWRVPDFTLDILRQMGVA
ncbi:MAG: ASCH domain-containing protein [bacterium]